MFFISRILFYNGLVLARPVYVYGQAHAAVWTDSEMIIWGGNTGSGIPLENGGGIYVP